MGIDYGLGTANRNVQTGIHYGIFPVSLMNEWFFDSVEPVYGFGCPHCGEEHDDNGKESRRCKACRKQFSRDEAWGDEPIFNGIGQADDNGNWAAWVDDSNDCWFTDSQFIYRANFASPCAPGAGYVGEILGADEGEIVAYGPDPELLSGAFTQIPREDGLILVVPKQ